MSRNGADVYSKLAGSVAVPNDPIESTPYNAQIDDLVNAVNDVAMLSGSKPLTGNQSAGGFKYTSLGAGTAAADAARTDQVQNDVVSHSTAVAGTADAIQVTFSPASTSLTTNERIRWKSGGANTITAPTLSKDAGVTNKTIKKGASAALAVGDTGASGYECEAVYNGTDWLLLNPAGSVSAASTTEVLTGTDAAKFATADAIAALWEAGANITDGAAITIGEGGYFNLITSTTAITSFVVTTDKAGRTFRVRFDTARTLTHNGTSLIIPGAANITTAQGDIAQIRSLGSGNVVVDWYTKADGTSIVATTVGRTLITTFTTTSGSTFSQTTGISGYATLELEFDGVDLDTSGSAINLAVSGDTGTNYGTATSIGGSGNNVRSGTVIVYGMKGAFQNAATAVTPFGTTYAATVPKHATGATSVINAIRITSSGDNFNGGSLRVYGVP